MSIELLTSMDGGELKCNFVNHNFKGKLFFIRTVHMNMYTVIMKALKLGPLHLVFLYELYGSGFSGRYIG